MWATVPSNSPYSPSQLAFSHDIIFCQQVLINWDLKWIHQNKVVKNNAKENRTHQEHNSPQHMNGIQNANYILQLRVPTPSLRSSPTGPSVFDVVMLKNLSAFNAFEHIMLGFSNPFSSHSQTKWHRLLQDTKNFAFICLFSDFPHFVHKIMGKDVLGSCSLPFF